jgi:D-lactate dehydrogenase
MRYAHLGCNVVHEDIAFQNEVDVNKCKLDIKHIIETNGGKLPAEHGHGTEYNAPQEVQERWMIMDPNNIMNPGVGGTKYTKDYS